MTTVRVSRLRRVGDLLGSEWIKVRSVRSTYLALIAAAFSALAIGVFSAVTVKTAHIDFTTFDPVDISLSGLLVVQLAFGVFGALAISSEYTTGTIRTSFAAVPRRRAVLAAKAAITGAVGLLAGEIISFAAFFAGQLALSRKHLSVTLADPGVLRAVAGAGFYLLIVTLVGLGLGAMIRHTAGAIAAVGLIFIQPLLVNLVFPDPGSRAGNYVLLWAGQSISSTRAHVIGYSSVGQAVVVCVAYVGVALAAAALLITRRDV